MAIEMKMRKYLNVFFDTVVDSLAFLSGALLILIMISISVDVIMRYFFNRPLFWVGELAEYALLYITFTGAAWVLKKDRHVKIDVLVAGLNPKKRYILDWFVNIICIFVCAVLTYYGAVVARDHFVRGVYNPTLMSFPKGPLLAIIPIGTLLLTIQFIRKAVISSKDSEKR
jgi:TRAP-type C4-dicarboxylate transport system permease small subunit